ncbi:MAG: Rrf2 family transcriptional regulator [Myxococcota bacterium]
MQLTSQEEYGLRCLLAVARETRDLPVGIPDIASSEGLSPEYAAKLMRLLRQGELVTSTRGANGGYRLSRPAEQMSVWSVIEVLGGPLFHESFCNAHSGKHDDCVHSGSASGCSIRAMWTWVGKAIRGTLEELTVSDLLKSESSVAAQLQVVQLPRSNPTPDLGAGEGA